MKKNSWILIILCAVVFIALRLIPIVREHREEVERAKPAIPEPVLVQRNLLSHPWVKTQPNILQPNVEMVRDLAAFDELCEAVGRQRGDWTYEQIQAVLIKTLTSLQKEIPFTFPEELYNVYCISETPLDWIKPPAPFHVYKRLYLGETDAGMPFYLDVRVFELGSCSAEKLIKWHLEMLDGEPEPLLVSENRTAYVMSGERKCETAHGFAQGERGIFVEFLERGEKLYVLYAEGPIKTFKENESIFKQLTQRIDDE